MTVATRAVRIGTRASRLAMAQAREAASALGRVIGEDAVEITPIRTRGDVVSERKPNGHLVVGDGQFTTELERALLERRIDVAVHSLKDLPTEPNPELRLGAILKRADPRDCLVSRFPNGLDGLPFGAAVGTGSSRRAAQLAAARIDLVAKPVRGNVDTRLARLDAGDYDALLLAAAGVDRLGARIRGLRRLPFDVMLPAPGQAAIALQVRADEGAIVEALDHSATRVAVMAERALLRALGGGCLAPLGVLAEVRNGTLRMRAAYEGSGGFARADRVASLEGVDELVAEMAAAIREATA